VRNAVFLLLALCACDKKVLAIGSSPADNVALKSSPEFAQYLGALSGAESFTVGDLYSKKLTFAAAPDPTPLLQAMQAGNP